MKGEIKIIIKQLGEEATICLTPQKDNNTDVKIRFGGKKLKDLQHTDIEGIVTNILNLLNGK